jgi:Xaa-Pro aminopeptidase
MFETSVYTERRGRLTSMLTGGLVLLPGNEESSMSYKANVYHFRQDSTFLYFLGLDRPGLVAVLDLDSGTETLFGDDISIEDLVWTGPVERLSAQAAKAGFTDVRPLKALDGQLSDARSKDRVVHFLPPYRPEHTLQLHHWLGIPIPHIPSAVSVDLIRAVVALRSVKSAAEVGEIEKGVNITNDMQLAAARGAREGMTEAGLAGVLHGIAVSAGGNLAFPTILTVNGQILHNHYSDHLLDKGRLVICDCGAETASHYGGDLTRTFPVDKTFTPLQKEVYQIVLDAQEAAITALRPGIAYKDVHLLACVKLVEGLQAIGLMTGDVQEAVAEGAHALFFQCGLGHMLGLDTHDMENLGEAYVGYTDTLTKSAQFGLKSLRLGRTLREGFVVTVEPGLYFIPELMDSWGSEKKLERFIRYDRLKPFRTFGGIRIEEDFLITAGGSRLIGDPIPKSADAIETLRSW